MTLRTCMLSLLLTAAIACSGADQSDKSQTDEETEETESDEETEETTSDTEVDLDIVINEVLAGNDSINTDAQGDNDDWLELYNAGDSEVDLSGWFLTDKEDDELELFELPDGTTLPSGAFLIIWCDGDVDDSSSSEVHLDFKLSGDGETVRLFDAKEAEVDSLTYPAIEDDIGYGRLPDGSDTLGETDPTPGDANEAAK